MGGQGSGRLTVVKNLQLKEIIELEGKYLLEWLKDPDVPREDKVKVAVIHLNRLIPNITKDASDTPRTIINIVRNYIPATQPKSESRVQFPVDSEADASA